MSTAAAGTVDIRAYYLRRLADSCYEKRHSALLLRPDFAALFREPGLRRSNRRDEQTPETDTHLHGRFDAAPSVLPMPYRMAGISNREITFP